MSREGKGVGRADKKARRVGGEIKVRAPALGGRGVGGGEGRPLKIIRLVI